MYDEGVEPTSIAINNLSNRSCRIDHSFCSRVLGIVSIYWINEDRSLTHCIHSQMIYIYNSIHLREKERSGCIPGIVDGVFESTYSFPWFGRACFDVKNGAIDLIDGTAEIGFYFVIVFISSCSCCSCSGRSRGVVVVVVVIIGFCKKLRINWNVIIVIIIVVVVGLLIHQMDAGLL